MSNLTNDPTEWLNEHGDYLYRYAMSRLRDEEQAADMVQETLLAAWKGYKNFSGNSSLRTWLVGILKHKIIDLIRKEIRGRNLSDAVEHDPTSAWFNDNGSWSEAPRAWQANPESLFEDEQFREALESCISKLPAKQQAVFRLREMIGEDTEEICNSCDISPTHLHVLIHRARLSLRKCLQRHWFGSDKQS